MKNPWETGEVYAGIRSAWCDATSRIDRVRETTDAAKFRDMIAWPDTQKTVRLAAERRLRKIEKGR
ncbi:MAG: hypothetical protein HQ546_05355 [Planctomycetes bacterium]|nr:hypothetical protein [Planctomycetota bacterium]